MQTIVIGFDGVPFDFLDRAIKKEYCPMIKGLITEGVSGKLRSTMPPISPVAWSSFITGKEPRNHGVFDWQVPENGRLRPTNANDRHGAPFWNYLTSKGLRVGVIGIPLTFPVRPIDGFMISGFDTIWESDKCCWPRDLKDILRKEFGDKADLVFSSRNDFDSEQDLLNYHLAKDEMDTEAAMFLAELFEIDTLIINYMTVDHLNHSARDEETILRGFLSFENCVKKLLEAYPQSQLLIMSDHGSYRNKGGFLICEVLKEAGLLEFNYRDIPKEHHMEILVRYLQGSLGLSGLGEKVLRRFCLYALNCLPNGIRNKIWKRIWDRDEKVFHVYWNLNKNKCLVELSTGFKAGVAEVYFKLPKSNDAKLNPGKLELTLKEHLSKVKDEKGNNYFLEIHNGHDFFAGPYAELAPDLIAIADTQEPEHGICLSYPMGGNSRVDGLFAYDADLYAYLMKGTHCQDGIYIFRGNEFKEDCTGPLMNIVDIPFLLLCLKGIPVPEDFDGRTYPELFTDSFYSSMKITYQPAMEDDSEQERMTDEEKEIVAETLKKLGYI